MVFAFYLQEKLAGYRPGFSYPVGYELVSLRCKLDICFGSMDLTCRGGGVSGEDSEIGFHGSDIFILRHLF